MDRSSREFKGELCISKINPAANKVSVLIVGSLCIYSFPSVSISISDLSNALVLFSSRGILSFLSSIIEIVQTKFIVLSSAMRKMGVLFQISLASS